MGSAMFWPSTMGPKWGLLCSDPTPEDHKFRDRGPKWGLPCFGPMPGDLNGVCHGLAQHLGTSTRGLKWALKDIEIMLKHAEKLLKNI